MHTAVDKTQGTTEASVFGLPVRKLDLRRYHNRRRKVPMPEQGPVLTRHNLEAKIVKRCWEDKSFHQELTTDPIGTAVKYLQVPAASLPKIVVHEEPPGSWHIVLPAKLLNTNELSEEELENVTGGVTPTVVATVAWSVVATVATSIVSSVSAAVSIKDG